MKTNFAASISIAITFLFSTAAFASALQCDHLLNMEMRAAPSLHKINDLIVSEKLPSTLRSAIRLLFSQNKLEIRSTTGKKPSLSTSFFWNRWFRGKKWILKIPQTIESERDLLQISFDLSVFGKNLENRERFFSLPEIRYNQRIQLAYDIALTKVLSQQFENSQPRFYMPSYYKLSRLPLSDHIHELVMNRDFETLRGLILKKLFLTNIINDSTNAVLWLTKITTTSTLASLVIALGVLHYGHSYFNGLANFDLPISDSEAEHIQTMVRISVQKTDANVIDWAQQIKWQDPALQKFVNSLERPQ